MNNLSLDRSIQKIKQINRLIKTCSKDKVSLLLSEELDGIQKHVHKLRGKKKLRKPSKLPKQPVESDVEPLEELTYPQFTCVGKITAKLICDKKDVLFVQFDRTKFKVVKTTLKFYNRLVATVKKNDENAVYDIRAYPQITWVNGKPNVAFLILSIRLNKGDNFNHFKVNGIYQHIPARSQPVLTIYRNDTKLVREMMEKFPEIANELVKATHLPISGVNSRHLPFNQVPGKSKIDRTSDTPLFLTLHATFDYKKCDFIVTEDFTPLTNLAIPNYLKKKKKGVAN